MRREIPKELKGQAKALKQVLFAIESGDLKSFIQGVRDFETDIFCIQIGSQHNYIAHLLA